MLTDDGEGASRLRTRLGRVRGALTADGAGGVQWSLPRIPSSLAGCGARLGGVSGAGLMASQSMGSRCEERTQPSPALDRNGVRAGDESRDADR